MSLRGLLAVFVALIGIWEIVRDVNFVLLLLQKDLLSNSSQMIQIALLLCAGFGMIFQRRRVAGLILGRRGDNTAITDRGLLAVGCAALGVQQLMDVLASMALNSGFHASTYVIAAVLIGSARWIPLWVGWGALDPAPFEE